MTRQILLCDEATSALDPETTQSILGLLREINQRLGLTIVLITHEMAVIRDICDRVVVLEHGRIVEQGPVWEVFGNPQHEVSKTLLAPLQHALPEELQSRLQAQPQSSDAAVVLRLQFTGSATRRTGSGGAVQRPRRPRALAARRRGTDSGPCARATAAGGDRLVSRRRSNCVNAPAIGRNKWRYWAMWFDRLLQGFIDTFLMVGVSSLIALLAGIPLAVILVTSSKGGIYEAPALNRALGAFVNLFRSIPFLILMVALIPFTRLIVGTTYGVWAAVVPLTIAATPFFARIAEVSLREVDHGLIEAAQAMGCRRWHIVWHVLLPEALPGIVGGFTITLVTMINSSAMAGAIGAGGLGDIAYRYGYQRFDSQIMLTVIVLLVVLVAVIQLGGDRLARGLNKR